MANTNTNTRAQWFQFPITNGHASDDGVDIGAPNNTPVWFPWSGQVIDASYHDYGGQVAVAIPGTDYIEYFIHLNEIDVNPGETIQPGQQIGTSGGGVGDNVLHNGTVQPAQSQNWYDGHSSGYHTEFGLFEGQTLAEFNQGWGNPARQLDPTPVIENLNQGTAPTLPTSDVSGAITGIPGVGGIPGAAGMAQILTNLFPWLANPELFKFRVISTGVAAAGVGLIGFGGLMLYSAVNGQTVIQTMSQARGKMQGQVARLAAAAAA